MPATAPSERDTKGEAATTPGVRARAANRWWVYQRERFPVFAHGPLILAFSFSAVSFSFLLRNGPGHPQAASLAVAFVTSFIFFLQLRIADEFKDFEEDSRYRPYRAVPRGLVRRRELGMVGAAGALVQLGLAFWLAYGWAGRRWWVPPLVGLLLITWTYLGLMCVEFFARTWLKARPITYMWTHMLIMPLIDLYATACDWQIAGLRQPPAGLFWFLVVSFCNGIVIEIGRKLRAPEREERGVQTYTVLWGRRAAVLAWQGAMLVTGICACLAARAIDFVAPMLGMLAALLSLAGIVAWRFLRQPDALNAKWFEPVSGIWTLTMYLGLGTIPLLMRLGRHL